MYICTYIYIYIYIYICIQYKEIYLEKSNTIRHFIHIRQTVQGFRPAADLEISNIMEHVQVLQIRTCINSNTFQLPPPPPLSGPGPRIGS